MISPELLMEYEFQQVCRTELKQGRYHKGEQEDENGIALLSEHSQKNERSHRINGYYGQMKYASVLEIVVHRPCDAHLVKPADKACDCELKNIAEKIP